MGRFVLGWLVFVFIGIPIIYIGVKLGDGFDFLLSILPDWLVVFVLPVVVGGGLPLIYYKIRDSMQNSNSTSKPPTSSETYSGSPGNGDI